MVRRTACSGVGISAPWLRGSAASPVCSNGKGAPRGASFSTLTSVSNYHSAHGEVAFRNLGATGVGRVRGGQRAMGPTARDGLPPPRSLLCLDMGGGDGSPPRGERLGAIQANGGRDGRG